jgi:hypothetical protein
LIHGREKTMTAKVVNFEQWKAAHPPALIRFQHGLQAWLAWQKLILKVMYGSR